MSPESVNSTEQPPVENQPEGQTTSTDEVAAAGRNNDGPAVSPELEALRAQNQQLEQYRQQVMQQQAMQREREFQASLAEMTPEERTIALQARRIQGLTQREQAAAQQLAQVEQNNQESAKRVLAAVLASDNELPPFAIGQLMQASTPEEMEAFATQIRSDIQSRYIPAGKYASQPPAQHQQAPQQPQVDPFAAGGANAGGMQPEKPKVGSGDLDALLGSTQYEVTSTF